MIMRCNEMRSFGSRGGVHLHAHDTAQRDLHGECKVENMKSLKGDANLNFENADLPKYSCSSSFSICSSMALVSSSIFFSASLGPVGFGGVTLNGRRGGGGGGDSAEAIVAAAEVEEATIGVEDDDDALDGSDAVAA